MNEKKEVIVMLDTEIISNIKVKKRDRETGYYKKIDSCICVQGDFEDPKEQLNEFNIQVHDLGDRIEKDLTEAGLGNIAFQCFFCAKEAIGNALSAHGDDKSIPIFFLYFRRDKDVRISVKDIGPGFDYEEFKRTRPIQPADIVNSEKLSEYHAKLAKYVTFCMETKKSAGIGLLALERAMDSVEYKNKNGNNTYNELVMIKKLEPKQDPDNS